MKKHTEETKRDRIPENIARQLQECIKRQNNGNDNPRKLLWLFFANDADNSANAQLKQSSELALNDWLNVIDEATLFNIDKLIVSVQDKLADHPHIAKICNWAQSTHNMQVGLHLSNKTISKNEFSIMSDFDPGKTYLLAPSLSSKSKEKMCRCGFTLCEPQRKPEAPPCNYPEDMLCVGPEGKIYPCGRVIGDKAFSIGDVRTVPIGKAVSHKDEAMLEIIHGKACKCNACAPLMAEDMNGKS